MDDVIAKAETSLCEIWDDEDQPGITDRALAIFHASKHLCESPIEVLMLAGLVGTGFGYGSEMNVVIPFEKINGHNFAEIHGHIIIPQMKLPQYKYRADFFVSLYTNGHRRVGLFVECDGHKYHSTTKEQAARDRKRDRDMQGLGVSVLRFTGSEIYQDLDECKAQIDLFGSDLIEREWVRNGIDVWGYEARQRRLSLGVPSHG